MAANVLVWLMSITRGFTPSFPKKFHCGHKQKKTPLDGNKLHLSWKRTIQIYCYTFFPHQITNQNCNTQAMCRSLIRMCSYGKRKTKRSDKRKSNQLVYYACGMCIYRYFTFLFWCFWLWETEMRGVSIRWFGIVPETVNHTIKLWYPHIIEMKMFDHWNSMSQAQSQFAVCEIRFFITFFAGKEQSPIVLYACRFSHNSKN